MRQLTINPNNRQYYSEDFIKGFNCGAQRQLEADKADIPTWIPCSERLPEENKRVLITTARGYMNIGWIKQNIWSTDLIVNLQDFVIAWMPLPKPWKGADDEDA